MWQIGFTMLIFFLGVYLPHGGLSIFVLCVATLSWLWIIQRVWSYQSSTEIEKRVQLRKLKLGYTLVFACMVSLSLYLAIDQIVGVDMIYMLYWLYLPGIGLLAAVIGIILLIQGRKLKPEEPLHDARIPGRENRCNRML